MTLLEAIKSGRPFKRKCWTTWAVSDGCQIVQEKNRDVLHFNRTSLLADDYEIKPPKPPECLFVVFHGNNDCSTAHIDHDEAKNHVNESQYGYELSGPFKYKLAEAE